MTRTGPATSGTVLYVEDSIVSQSLMRSLLLQRPGVRLLVVGLGVTAVETALTERPGLVLLDRHLPDMSGTAVLRALRSHEETSSIPVVIVSGDTGRLPPDEELLGVVAYFVKPFDLRELLACIDKLLAVRA